MPRKKSKAISRRQEEILDYIKAETETQGYPPPLSKRDRAGGRIKVDIYSTWASFTTREERLYQTRLEQTSGN